MNDPSREEQIAAARAYESLHVPALFAEWAEPVLDAAEVGAGQRLVDVACGTGALTRVAHARTGPAGVGWRRHAPPDHSRAAGTSNTSRRTDADHRRPNPR